MVVHQLEGLQPLQSTWQCVLRQDTLPQIAPDNQQCVNVSLHYFYVFFVLCLIYICVVLLEEPVTEDSHYTPTL